MKFSHVLISRPEAECAQLAATLQAAGLASIRMPAHRFAPTLDVVENDAAWRGSKTRLAVFTSPRAVEFGVRGIAPSFLDDTQIAAIGPATATALEKAGLVVDLMPLNDFSSEGLLSLEALRNMPGMATIFAARGGRDALRNGLQELGWEVRMAWVYERRPLTPGQAAVDELLDGGPVLSVWTSGSALEQLLNSLPAAAVERILAGPMLVVSQRLARLATARGAGEVHVASGPDNASLVEAVRRVAGTN